MSEYESCSNCNATIRLTNHTDFDRCEQCQSLMCRDCVTQGCIVCKTERNLLLKVPHRPRGLAEDGQSQ